VVNRFSAVLNELEISERLVKDALQQVSSVQVLKEAEKQNVQVRLQEAIESLKAARVFGRACANAVQPLESGPGPRVAYAAGGASNHAAAGQRLTLQRKRENGL
jgi:hypothetical protein